MTDYRQGTGRAAEQDWRTTHEKAEWKRRERQIKRNSGLDWLIFAVSIGVWCFVVYLALRG